MQDLKLTVLDQSPVHPNESAAHSSNAGQMSIELAKTCDQLGYARYWVAEHHNSPQFAGPCPEILIAAIASVTRNMRVGSGGVMLSHYSPYKVAETFNMLNALFPNRIDLGIGRAPGGDALASSALAWPSQPLDSSTYPGQASILKALLEQNLPDDHAWADLHISPTLSTATENIAPEMWMLGSSGGSAKLAGQAGMNLALARFISPDHCHPDIFDAYDQARAEAGHKEKANRMLAIACFCADTQEEAELLASTAVYRKMRLQPKGQEDLLTPEAVQNLRKQFTPIQEDQYRHLMEGYTVGTPERCKTEIDTLAKAFGTNEIALVTVTHDFAARLKSYQLLMG
ncbi:MsnO8 family LLM class oxidoreductase [Marinomonas transparens]|uniref:MsnO8 family LLM class oxidoreductase n=1 Tax=Marinomonas transparens TaxID=2795388 RepID=A0A934JZW7_9GAMM|nr:MsnO8 family LLM class oxidoreductase [Marinomonas transparens]MBJ7539952.1 MsnO8 family LLM class oxidoreductase [Marinomonas transparens]